MLGAVLNEMAEKVDLIGQLLVDASDSSEASQRG